MEHPLTLPAATPHPFVLLDSIQAPTQEGLVAERHFGEGAAAWEYLEAAAQAACLHQREVCQLEDQVFLLAVDEMQLSAVLPQGKVRLQVTLTGQASQAASYTVHLEDAAGRRLEVRLVAGRRPYHSQALQEQLTAHYRKVFACLVRPNIQPNVQA